MPRHAQRPALLPFAAGLVLVLASGAAVAQDDLPAVDRVSVALGAYFADTATRIAADRLDSAQSGNFAMEDDLGFPAHETVPRARIQALLGGHQGISLDYYRVNRSQDQAITRDLTYDGTTYAASAQVHGRLDFDFGSAAWRWWFGSGRDAFGVGLGAAYYQVRASLRGQASVAGMTQEAATGTSERAWAPLLQLGWRHAFDDQWRVYLDASGVKKNGGALSGHIYNAALGVEWFPWRHLGFGGEYDYSRIKLYRAASRYDASLDMRLDGPSMFVRLRW